LKTPATRSPLVNDNHFFPKILIVATHPADFLRQYTPHQLRLINLLMAIHDNVMQSLP
jgi:hypothetical protein